MANILSRTTTGAGVILILAAFYAGLSDRSVYEAFESQIKPTELYRRSEILFTWRLDRAFDEVLGPVA